MLYQISLINQMKIDMMKLYHNLIIVNLKVKKNQNLRKV